MKLLYCTCLLLVFVGFIVAPPVDKQEKASNDHMYDTKGLSDKDAQDKEYYRYLTQVVKELEKDPTFSKMLDNVTDEDVKSGKVVHMLDVVGHKIRKKVDEIKRVEVEYQRDLLRQRKHHMAGIDKNYWNPIHHDNKDTFEKEDLVKLIRKHNEMIEEQDKIRHEDYKKHELEKEHLRREAMKNMTSEEKVVAEKKHEESHHQPHEKIHEPGHKAQLEEVWEKEDGFDPDSFDPRTFFHFHDKNNDGYLDYFEQETLFVNDLDKVYNESDPNMDPWEREEEMERMRTHMLKIMDHDRDGLVSQEEFLAEAKDDEFEKDEEWKPLTDEEQLFSDDEFKDFERLFEEQNNKMNKRTNEEHFKVEEKVAANDAVVKDAVAANAEKK